MDWAVISENNLDIIEKGLTIFKNNSTLWLLKVKESQPSQIISIYKESLSHIKGKESYLIWSSYLDYLIKIKSETVSLEFTVILLIFNFSRHHCHIYTLMEHLMN